MPSPTGPTAELGQVTAAVGRGPGGAPLPTWGSRRTAGLPPQMVRPQLYKTVAAMLSDAQIEGLVQGVELPISRYDFTLDPNGVPDDIMAMIAEDVGLPIDGQEARDPADRPPTAFDFHQHLSEAIEALWEGLAPFEQVGVIIPDANGRRWWRLRKLAPRHPRTIAAIDVASNGGVEALHQNVPGSVDPARIPIERAVLYCWQRKRGQGPAGWYGRSMLTSLYRHYVSKDFVMQKLLTRADRNSLGIPWFDTSRNKDLDDDEVKKLARTAQAARSGDWAGGAGPADLQLVGVSGQVIDLLADLSYHDRQMSQAFMATYTQLAGAANGSRALADPLIDVYDLAIDAIVEWFRRIFTQHVLRDWVAFNIPAEQAMPAPILKARRRPGAPPAIADLAALVDAGVIIPDDGLEDSLRAFHGLPAADRDTSRQPQTATASARPRARSRHTAASAHPGGKTREAAAEDPDPERRDLTQAELDAGLNAQEMDEQWQANLADMLAQGAIDREAQAAELVDAVIAAAGSLTALAAITAAPADHEPYADIMRRQLGQGVDQATAEAAHQGVTLDTPPDVDDARDSLTERAQATQRQLADDLAGVARRRALQATGGTLTPEQVAQEVADAIGELSDRYLRDTYGGNLMSAQNLGRAAYITAAGEQGYLFDLYASEVLDGRTCEPCWGIDGEQLDDLAEARALYPNGGYLHCKGGPRCRGTFVAVYRGAGQPG